MTPCPKSQVSDNVAQPDVLEKKVEAECFVHVSLWVGQKNQRVDPNNYNNRVDNVQDKRSPFEKRVGKLLPPLRPLIFTRESPDSRENER
jgi:hypothetical protein